MSTIDPLNTIDARSNVRPLRSEFRDVNEVLGANPGGGSAALGEYWRVLLRSKWTILMLAVLGIVIGALKGMSAVPIYRASLSLAI